jgi:hypothetical protein
LTCNPGQTAAKYIEKGGRPLSDLGAETERTVEVTLGDLRVYSLRAGSAATQAAGLAGSCSTAQEAFWAPGLRARVSNRALFLLISNQG